MPPENSCGKAVARWCGLGMPTVPSSSIARRAGRVAADALVDENGLGDLVAHGVDGRQRRERVLEDHRDPAAADRRQIAVGPAEQLLAVEPDRARDARRGRQQSHDGQRRHRLARPGLADDAEDLARPHLVARCPARRSPAPPRCRTSPRGRRRRAAGWTRRPGTVAPGCGQCVLRLGVRIEGVAQAVADEVDRQHEQRRGSPPGSRTPSG